ncbi:MAG: sulfatase-like hydrolase/transferase [Marinilabiliaceae bacterium]|nr:sulfatase-like hydrolase/transferase [Marinilabiliaceae bacterium]
MKIVKFFKENPVWVIFFVSLLVLFLKCVLFIAYTTRFPLNLIYFWKQYAMYIGVSGIIVSFVFLTKWKWWIVIVFVVLDIWLVGNLMYWRSYDDLLSVWCLNAVGNMKGIWSSIFVFLEWKDCIFLILTLFVTAALIFISDRKQTQKLFFIVGFPFFLLLTLPQVITKTKSDNISLFSDKFLESWNYVPYEYCRAYTPITYLVYQIKILVSKPFYESYIPEVDEEVLRHFFQKRNRPDDRENLNLLLVVFESLESWIINSEINNQQITPNLNKLLTNTNLFYADKVTSQVRSGLSSDGLLIINTGLLPIYNGIIVHRFQNNFYFSLCKSLQEYNKHAYVVDDDFVWNQGLMLKSYGYDLISFNNGTDYQMCKHATEQIPKKPFLLKIISFASHAPFKELADSSTLLLPKDMPTDISNYIKSVNYTDNALGLLFDGIEKDSTIIVVVGDHTIFHKEKREQFKQYCIKNNIDIPVEKEFVPLIIYSPEIKERIAVQDTIYQMDIYPTLLHLLNREDYIWQGFGINLLDSTANRKISPDDALKLSDAIIRNDYLRKLSNEN